MGSTHTHKRTLPRAYAIRLPGVAIAVCLQREAAGLIGGFHHATPNARSILRLVKRATTSPDSAR